MSAMTITWTEEDRARATEHLKAILLRLAKAEGMAMCKQPPKSLPEDLRKITLLLNSLIKQLCYVDLIDADALLQRIVADVDSQLAALAARGN